ncbi:hypothetical protein CesoFtcFv8_013157 [Champsocephalus esox]|uniref:Uncharacterized protein n=1 Tax=Champsocephalus esox TaxID=159716 RepID=A0AAN8GVF2_9TELE|nr:hypothetical protein CesoFtcFv8_013157 [Champsocephalus esox]
MPTNNLSLALGPGREEEEEEDEEETGSARTKCPAQGRETQKMGNGGDRKMKRWKRGRDQDSVENTVSS